MNPLVLVEWDRLYRARDTKLNREVAIKVLLPAFASDPERLARFRREAQLLAALNHPNIAHLYGLEGQEGGTEPYLVMELVEGPTLAEAITASGLPLDEALPIARQVADALAAAHDQGTVHRDLKPANIKVRSDGTVKVLDFGLAKAMEGTGKAGGARGAPEFSQSPTITTPAMTAAGMILGTAAYMVPEQAKGREVDKRADLWAFGCVLYEMLTGARVFAADDVSDTMAHVLLKDPDWTRLPSNTPAAIRRLLKRCLEKDPRKRLDSASAARLEIDEAAAEHVAPEHPAPAAPEHPARRNHAGPWLLAALSTIAAARLLALWAPWKTLPEPP